MRYFLSGIPFKLVERELRRFWLRVFICLALGFALCAQAQDEFAEIDHVVVAGETLTFIANTYGLTVEDIAASNDIDPSAILRVGQSLRIVFPVAEPTSEAIATATPNPAQNDHAEAREQDVPKTLSGGQSDAPVAMADAPRQELSLLDPQLCVAMFSDNNHNSMLDPGEQLLSGGEIALRAGDDSKIYVLEDQIDSFCIDGLARLIYDIVLTAPADHSLTGSSTLRLDLRNGMPLALNIGAIAGASQPPPIVAPPPTTPRQDAVDAPKGLLGQISGLLVVGLAVIVFVSGSGLALFLRWR